MSTPTPADLKRAAVLAAKLAGCTCDVEVELEQVDGIHHAHVHHDSWCALLTRLTKRRARWN